MVAAHVVVEDVGCDTLRLGASDAHHLAASLRLRPGEEVSATDGAGGWRLYRWDGRGLLSALSAPVLSERPAPSLTVGFAPVKGGRPEWAVQKLVELGVDRILLLRTARSVVRWGRPQLERMARVARQALMQSRGVWLPLVEGPVDFEEAVRLPGVALASPGGDPPGAGCTVVLVGPEGGWSPEELAVAPAKVALGPTVLRAETAAVAAGAILCALRSGLVACAGGADPSRPPPTPPAADGWRGAGLLPPSPAGR